MAALVQASGFQEGSLPVKYLGVPLISSRLKNEHCMELVDKITSKITSWEAKELSYAGRVQLIKAILHSIPVYWCAIFILPQATVNLVEAKCRKYLWNGNEDKKKNLIAWEKVCKPKNEGGLGIFDLVKWNMALVGKQIWKILINKSALWAVWVTKTKLKLLSFWGIKKQPDISDTWRSVLNLRGAFKEGFSYNRGSQKQFSFSYDPWINEGAIADLFPGIEMTETDTRCTATVGQMRRHNTWRLLPLR